MTPSRHGGTGVPRRAIAEILLVGRDARAAGRRFLEDHGFLLASAISFSFLICLAPLLLVLSSIAGFLLESDRIADYVLDSATIVFPAYASEAASFIGVLIRERGVSGLLGGIGLTIFATELFSLSRLVLNRIFRVDRRRRLLHGFLFDLLAVVIGGSLVVSSAMTIVVLLALGDLAHQLVPLPVLRSSGARTLLTQAVIYATGLSLLFAAYRTFPNTWVPPRAAALATLVVTLLWGVGRWAFTEYVTAFGVYGKLYGSFGIAVAALVWIYYSAAMFVFGAELAAILAERELLTMPARRRRRPA